MATNIEKLSQLAANAANNAKQKSAAVNTGSTQVYQTTLGNPAAGDIDPPPGSATMQALRRVDQNIANYEPFPAVGTKLSQQQASVLNQADQTIAYASNPGLMSNSGMGGNEGNIPGNFNTGGGIPDAYKSANMSREELTEFQSNMIKSGSFTERYPSTPEMLYNEIVLPNSQKAASLTDERIQEILGTNFFELNPELADIKVILAEA